jgi:hypothetical protein
MVYSARSSKAFAPATTPWILASVLLAWPLTACAGGGEEGGGEKLESSTQEARAATLGPRDGHDLPPTDLDRVAVGLPAPDFALRTLAGDTVSLSDFRGSKNVVLVFYRGHW